MQPRRLLAGVDGEDLVVGGQIQHLHRFWRFGGRRTRWVRKSRRVTAARAMWAVSVTTRCRAHTRTWVAMITPAWVTQTVSRRYDGAGPLT